MLRWKPWWFSPMAKSELKKNDQNVKSTFPKLINHLIYFL